MMKNEQGKDVWKDDVDTVMLYAIRCNPLQCNAIHPPQPPKKEKKEKEEKKMRLRVEMHPRARDPLKMPMPLKQPSECTMLR